MVDLSPLDSLTVRPRAEKVSVRHLTGPIPTVLPARSASRRTTGAPLLLVHLLRHLLRRA